MWNLEFENEHVRMSAGSETGATMDIKLKGDTKADYFGNTMTASLMRSMAGIAILASGDHLKPGKIITNVSGLKTRANLDISISRENPENDITSTRSAKHGTINSRSIAGEKERSDNAETDQNHVDGSGV